jgi:hypothetical protein
LAEIVGEFLSRECTDGRREGLVIRVRKPLEGTRLYATSPGPCT